MRGTSTKITTKLFTANPNNNSLVEEEYSLVVASHEALQELHKEQLKELLVKNKKLQLHNQFEASWQKIKAKDLKLEVKDLKRKVQDLELQDEVNQMQLEAHNLEMQDLKQMVEVQHKMIQEQNNNMQQLREEFSGLLSEKKNLAKGLQ